MGLTASPDPKHPALALLTCTLSESTSVTPRKAEIKSPMLQQVAIRSTKVSLSHLRAHLCRLPCFRARPNFQRAGNGAVGIVSNFMAGQDTAVIRAVIRNCSAIVLSYDVGVEVHQALARDTWRNRSHAVRRMADRTGETLLRNVIAVLQEAGIANHVGEVMAFGAHSIRATEGQVRVRKKVCDQSPRRRRLAELIIVFEDV